MYSIKAVAERTGKTTRALRYYEQLGILTPESRTDAGYRLYSERALIQIEWIDKLNKIGFSLPEIRDFLSDFESMETASDLMEGLQALYQEKLLEVEQQIAHLQQLASELRESVEFADRCKPCQLRPEEIVCSSCNKYGHAPISVPVLIAGVQESLHHSTP